MIVILVIKVSRPGLTIVLKHPPGVPRTGQKELVIETLAELIGTLEIVLARLMCRQVSKDGVRL